MTANFWIIPTHAESWQLVKERNVYAFHREADRDKIKPGDQVAIYLVRSDPPVLVGTYEIAGPWEEAKEPFWPSEKIEGKVIYPWRFHLTPLRLGAADIRRLSKQLSFIENKDVWSAYLIGSIGNFQRPIPESDYRLILYELAKPSIGYQMKPPVKRKAVLAAKIPRRRIPQLRGPPPSHNEIRDMIHELGLMKGVVSEVEYPINDMRLDVAWRTTSVRENPDHAWEVQISGNFFEALAKLKHAWDLWKADPYLVTTERFEEEARKQLGGTFHEIKPHIRIVNWRKIVQLYRLLKQASEVEKDLRL